MLKTLPSGCVIHYKSAGEGAVTLLFIHGAFMDLAAWNEQAEHFQENFRVLRIDLPGHGYSTSSDKDWSMAGMAADLQEFIEVMDLGNLIIIGHSLGAEVGLILSASLANRVLGFIAVDMFRNAGQPFPDERKQQYDQLVQRMEADFANTSEQYVHMALITPGTPEEVSRTVIRTYRDANPELGLALVKDMANTYLVEQEFMPRLQVKLYLLVVDYMPIDETPLKQLAAKGYELLHLEGSSHFPMLEMPGLLNHYLDYVIDKIVSPVELVGEWDNLRK